jgi:hypothetical protein
MTYQCISSLPPKRLLASHVECGGKAKRDTALVLAGVPARGALSPITNH